MISSFITAFQQSNFALVAFRDSDEAGIVLLSDGMQYNLKSKSRFWQDRFSITTRCCVGIIPMKTERSHKQWQTSEEFIVIGH